MALGVAALLLLSGWDRERAGSNQSDRDRYHDRTFTVARVIDGDTIDLDAADGSEPHTRVRLIGVDAPELGLGDDSAGRADHYGHDAAEFARRVLEGRPVHVVLKPDETRDRYGRLLAYVCLERGGPFFNLSLVETGCAYADRRFAHPYVDRFVTAEKRARKERRGLWEHMTLERMPEWRRRYETQPD